MDDDDATDGEHPPVYLPNLNSTTDDRCAMNKILRGSTAEHTVNALAKTNAGADGVVAPLQRKPAPVAPSGRSPQAQRKMQAIAKTNAPSPSAVVGNGNGNSDEQWIDGPRVHKSRMSQVRHLVRHQRETWIDGPPAAAIANAPSPKPVNPVQPAMVGQSTVKAVNPNTAPSGAATGAATAAAAAAGYGFMDEHKQGMIRQWVATQSAQVYNL